MSLPDPFTPATRAWFEATFAAPTDAQREGWEAIAAGHHTLIHAPTGSGKTLAAFLWGIDRLAAGPVPDEAARCRLLYVSPMKALAYDIERNLRAPLTGIRLAATELGVEPPPISTAMRTGDTPSRDRQAMVRHPPDILITTPESLYLMLTSQARSILTSVQWVIVDEIHSVASSKRGSHLALSLERLTRLTTESGAGPPQRIGLSATQRPLETIAEFLGGGEPVEDGWQPRPVSIVDAPGDKTLDLEIVVPVSDMTRPETSIPTTDEETTPRSIWPAVYPRLLEQVLAHRSTIIFVNSRGAAERLAAELNRLAGDELVQSHHGSVSREQRVEIESKLKRGELRAVVATSTLELGIDMAAVDLVLLVESPASVATGLQRVGRAGHQVGAPSVARIYPNTAPTCWRARSSSTGCWPAPSRRPRSPATRSTSSPSSWSPWSPPSPPPPTTSTTWCATPPPTATWDGPASTACSTCWPAATRPTSSPSCAPGSCGTAPPVRSAPGTTPGCWR